MEGKWGHNAIIFTQKNIEENHYLYRGLNVKTCAKKILNRNKTKKEKPLVNYSDDFVFDLFQLFE